jgi:tRNA A-37 threonylcarbamoyl transferase component Bud32
MASPRLFTDTTDFTSIEFGDEIVVGGSRYTVTGLEKERRFGIEDPKFWVKRVVDVDTGERKIIKLSFFESFFTSFGGVKIRCFRDPEKEAEILKLVTGHPSFMQGVSCYDVKGNNIRVLDIVRGNNFFLYVDSIRMPHEKYFHEVLPSILKNLVDAFAAIGFVHRNGFRHGDIRSDHLMVSPKDSAYIWIDFDYDFDARENPFGLDIFGLGNILAYAVGKGYHNYYMIMNDAYTYGDLKDRLVVEDFSIIHKNRLLNLQKLFPYIPRMLNDIILHFSAGATIYYEFVDELIEDLNGYLRSI